MAAPTRPFSRIELLLSPIGPTAVREAPMEGSRKAIRADEAIGPGVYHGAIRALALSFDVCAFYGLERRL